MVEHRTENPGVGSSILPLGIKNRQKSIGIRQRYKLIDSKKIRDRANIDLAFRIQTLTFEVIKILISLIKNSIKTLLPNACILYADVAQR